MNDFRFKLLRKTVYNANLHEVVWIKYGGESFASNLIQDSDLEKYVTFYTDIEYEKRKNR